MNKSLTRRAICTFLALLVVSALPAEAGKADLSRYKREQLDEGARAMPVMARIAYRDGVAALAEGDREGAETLLQQSIEYQRDYPDPYFTFVRLKILQLDPEAAIYLVDALLSTWRNFAAQGLLIVNLFATFALALILVSLIVCVSFSLRYFPFAAHQLRESLVIHFRASSPGFTSYLLLLTPLVLLPGIVTSLAYLTLVCWSYLRRRERGLVITLFAFFIVMGLGGSYLKSLSVIADPASLTSLATRVNDSAGTKHLITTIENTKAAPGLEAERSIALGLLQQRRGMLAEASNHFRDAITQRPEDPIGYINLGNVHFLQGNYEKALQGYRKAEGIEPMDAVCQHNLAQAYIKTLLMKEASQALQLASELGIDRVKESYTDGSLRDLPVLPKLFSNSRLWRMAWVEGRSTQWNILDELMRPYTGFPIHVSAWILLCTLLVSAITSKIVPPSKLTFQCSNCGNLTCEKCCKTERDMHLCHECMQAIKGVSSEKVIGALLRQKRQAAIVKRGRSSRAWTRLLPGIREVANGQVARATRLSALFAVSVVHLLNRGYVVPHTLNIMPDPPLWQWILPAFGLLVAYVASATTKVQHNFRTRRTVTGRMIHEPKGGPAEPARAA